MIAHGPEAGSKRRAHKDQPIDLSAIGVGERNPGGVGGAGVRCVGGFFRGPITPGTVGG